MIKPKESANLGFELNHTGATLADFAFLSDVEKVDKNNSGFKGRVHQF